MTKEEYFERGETNIYYDLVPRERVELDMTCGDGIVSDAARSYYLENYATEEQKAKMKIDDLMNRIATIAVVSVTVVMAIAGLLEVIL